MTMISDVLDGLTDIPAIDPIKAGVESLLAMLRAVSKISPRRSVRLSAAERYNYILPIGTKKTERGPIAGPLPVLF